MSDQSPPSIEDQQQQALVMAALRTPGLRIYANGFAVANSASDVSVVLVVNGSPAGILSLSHTSAKSLAVSLTKAIAQFEQATSQEIKTIDELKEKLPKGFTIT
jgi:hypothetical protein